MAVTTEIPKLNINELIRNGYIVQGKYREGNCYQATPADPELIITSDLTTENRFVEIIFGMKHCIIKIQGVPSNLKKNSALNLYWCCPLSSKLAKVLYFDPQNMQYVSRKAYPTKIYYPMEILKSRDRIFAYSVYNQEKLLKSFLQLKKRKKYNCQPTRIRSQIKKQLDRKILLDRLINEFESQRN